MLKKFVSYYKPHMKLFIIDMLCALTISIVDLIFPIITNTVLREIIPSDEFDSNVLMRIIISIGIILVVFYVIRFILSFIIGYYGHVMGIRIETDMRRDLFKKFQELDYQYYDDKKTGVLMTNLTTHLHDISEMSHHAPEDIFISLIMLVGSFTYLVVFCNPILTIIVFVFLLMLIFYSISRRRKMMRKRTKTARFVS